MPRSLTNHFVTAIAAATAAAGLAIVFAFAVPTASSAQSKTEAALQLPAIKGDRAAERLKGTACAAASWPHYDHHCLFDRRRPANDAGAVRIIALR